MRGLSTRGSISLGCALVAGRKRVPKPAAGNTAFLTLGIIDLIVGKDACRCALFPVKRVCRVRAQARSRASAVSARLYAPDGRPARGSRLSLSGIDRFASY